MTDTNSFTKLRTTRPVPIIKDRAHPVTIYGTEVSWRAGSKSPHLIIGWHTVDNPSEKFEVVNHLYVKPDKPQDRHCLQNLYRVNAWVAASGRSKPLSADEVSIMHQDGDWEFLHDSNLYVVTVERTTPDGFGYSHPIVLISKHGHHFNLEVTPDEAKRTVFKVAGE